MQEKKKFFDSPLLRDNTPRALLADNRRPRDYRRRSAHISATRRRRHVGVQGRASDFGDSRVPSRAYGNAQIFIDCSFIAVSFPCVVLLHGEAGVETCAVNIFLFADGFSYCYCRAARHIFYCDIPFGKRFSSQSHRLFQRKLSNEYVFYSP